MASSNISSFRSELQEYYAKYAPTTSPVTKEELRTYKATQQQELSFLNPKSTRAAPTVPTFFSGQYNPIQKELISFGEFSPEELRGPVELEGLPSQQRQPSQQQPQPHQRPLSQQQQLRISDLQDRVAALRS